jgi:hypothetical protein
MRMKTDTCCVLLSCLMLTLALGAGCAGQAGPVPPAGTVPAEPAASSATSAVPPHDLSLVTRVEVTTMKAAWTNGPVSDGITVHPALVDAAGQKVQWSGVTLPVDIEIYSVVMDNQAKPARGQKVYGGHSTITNWTDGDPFKAGGIRIPYNHLEVPTGERYGWTYATVHLPDGRTLTGQFNATDMRQPAPF